MHADIFAVQRLDDRARMRLAGRRFVGDIRRGGGCVADQMFTAACALIQRLEQVGQFKPGIGLAMREENALRQSGMSRALSIAMTRAGMRMICRMMPGMAVVTAPARKSAGVKALCARPASR